MKLKILTLYALLNIFPLNTNAQDFNHKYELYVELLGSKSTIGTALISREADTLSARVSIPYENIELKLEYILPKKEYFRNDTLIQDISNTYNIFTAYLAYLDSLENCSIKNAEFNLRISDKPKKVKLTHIKTEEQVHTYMLKTDKGGIEILDHKEISHLIIECSQDKNIFYIRAKRKFSFFDILKLNFKDGLDVHGYLVETKNK